MPWNPAVYATFSQPRLRPALDLMTRIHQPDARRIADIGCGPGNVTAILADHWPQADISGIDSSAEMLEAAQTLTTRIRWQRADAAAWTAPEPLDILFSNAALQWLKSHSDLFPRLFRQLAPGGVLAVQMPHNHYAASHTVMAEAAEAGPWADRLRPLARRFPVESADFYYDLLAPLAVDLDIWETEYLHVLDGDNPVVRWTLGTALRPLLDALEEPDRGRFLAEYSRRIAAAYPPRDDGKTLFPFRRMFIVARAK